MDMQTNASFRKEFLAFFRTNKFLILALVLIGLSILNPLMYAGRNSMMDLISDVYGELGMDVSGLTDALNSPSSSQGVSSAIMDITQTSLIVFLLVINSNAGGELKKRSVMIPRSAGLQSFSYIFPKFIVYPLAGFVLALASAFASWGISSVIFQDNDVVFLGVLLGGALVGVCMMFYICAHITIGTATGKAGLSATVCILVSLILPNAFMLFGSERVYNPFMLNVLAATAVTKEGLSILQPVEVIVTVLFTLALMAIMFFVALFAQNARKIDNTGNEIRI